MYNRLLQKPKMETERLLYETPEHQVVTNIFNVEFTQRKEKPRADPEQVGQMPSRRQYVSPGE